MVNYDDSIIYKLCCIDPNITEIYVGSTTDFTSRKSQHKNSCNNKNNKRHNLYVYQFIRDNGGWVNFDMVQIEQYSAKNKHDLHSRERYYIETLKAGLNQKIPTRTSKEYRKDNEEKLKSNKRQYYIDNKERLEEYNKEYRDNHKDHKREYDKKYRNDNTDKISDNKKKYYIDNADVIKEKSRTNYQNNRDKYNIKRREYYEKNKARISAISAQKTTCICGSIVRKSDLNRHMKTEKHEVNMTYLDE